MSNHFGSPQDEAGATQRPLRIRRRPATRGESLLSVVMILIVLAAAVYAIIGTMHGNANHKKDTDARAQAVAVQMVRVKALTHGAISLSKPVAEGDWDGREITVTLAVGSCVGVQGYFPDNIARPSSDQVGPLYVIIPGDSPTAPAAYLPLSDSTTLFHLEDTLNGPDSALAHCVKDDWRLHPVDG